MVIGYHWQGKAIKRQIKNNQVAFDQTHPHFSTTMPGKTP